MNIFCPLFQFSKSWQIFDLLIYISMVCYDIVKNTIIWGSNSAHFIRDKFNHDLVDIKLNFINKFY